jgi:hypothetical protein
MPQRIRAERPATRFRPIVLCGLIAAGVSGSFAGNAQEAACKAPQQSMQQVEILFGRNIGRRLGVSAAAWTRFLAREVTPRFPNGLSVLDVAGQWRDKGSGRVLREPTKLVVILTTDDAPADDKIADIVAAYKQRFHQHSVGVITRPVCAAF